MADERELAPIHFENDMKVVYDAALAYFMPDRNQYHITSKHFDDRGFVIGLFRNYNIIANEYKGDFTLAGLPGEEGGTDIIISAKTKDSDSDLETGVRQRMEAGIKRQTVIEEQGEKALEEPVSPEEAALRKKREKRGVIITLTVAVIIILGTIPASCSQYWLF